MASKHQSVRKPPTTSPVLNQAPVPALASAPARREVEGGRGIKRAASQYSSDRLREAKRARDESEKSPNLQPQQQRVKSFSEVLLSQLKKQVTEGCPPQDLTLESLLGSGSFGSVYLATTKEPKQSIAIKIQELTPRTLSRPQILLELSISKDAKHENLIHYIASYVINNKLWMMMEYIDGLSMEQVIHHHALKGTKIHHLVFGAIVKRILLGLEYLHSHQYIHRDLKPANVMVSKQGDVKIIDFGLGTRQRFDYSTCGTLVYMAPEVIQRSLYDSQIDIWSFGMMATAMVNNKKPFHEEHMRETIKQRILNNELPTLENIKQYPKELSPFILSCLQADPVNRFTASELLEHRFIYLYDSTKGIIGLAIRKICQEKNSK